MEMVYTDDCSFYLIVKNAISLDKNDVETTFVNVVYYQDKIKYYISFYTNIAVSMGNIRELAETYSGGLELENGYQEKLGIMEKTHSNDMELDTLNSFCQFYYTICGFS